MLAPDHIEPWELRLLVQLESGDLEGYRRVPPPCSTGSARSSTQGGPAALVWWSTVVPDVLPDPALAVKLAERAIGEGAGHLARRSLGGILLRLGRFEEAIRWLDKAVISHGHGGDDLLWLMLALGHYHLGHLEEGGFAWPRPQMPAPTPNPRLPWSAITPRSPTPVDSMTCSSGSCVERPKP